MNLKTISSTTQERLHRLHGTRSVWQRISGAGEDRAALLLELGACGEPAVLMEILSWLVDSDREIRNAAQSAVESLLCRVPPDRLAELEVRIRQGEPQRPHERATWLEMPPADLGRLCGGNHEVSALGLASFHPNGRIREVAVRFLDQSGNGSELPFLLLRVNDWVEPIRCLAERLVRKRLTPEYADSFVRNLHLVVRLEYCGRAAHSALLADIAKLLRSPQCREMLLDGVRSEDRAIRRMCFRIVSELEGSDKLAILRSALSDPDPIIRSWTASRVLKEADGDDFRRIVTELCRDPFAPVRLVALQTVAERLSEEASDQLTVALLDRNAAVRETARYFLRRRGDQDFASVYRDKLANSVSKTLGAAICGLGETRSAVDADVLRPFVAAGRPVNVRKAAVTALGRLAPRSERDMFFTALADDQPGVSLVACRTLGRRADTSDCVQIRDLARCDERTWVRKNALTLVARLGKWDRLPILVMSLGDEVESIAQAALVATRGWWLNYNRSFVEPTPEQIAEIENELQKHRDRLDLGLREDLEQLVKEKRRR